MRLLRSMLSSEFNRASRSAWNIHLAVQLRHSDPRGGAFNPLTSETFLLLSQAYCRHQIRSSSMNSIQRHRFFEIRNLTGELAPWPRIGKSPPTEITQKEAQVRALRQDALRRDAMRYAMDWPLPSKPIRRLTTKSRSWQQCWRSPAACKMSMNARAKLPEQSSTCCEFDKSGHGCSRRCTLVPMTSTRKTWQN